MKLLHVISSTDPTCGGPIEGVIQGSRVLSKLGHTVEILSLDSPDSSWLADSQFPIHALGPGKFKFAFSSLLGPWIKVNAKNYDALIINGLWQYHGWGVWNALRNCKTPYYVFSHGMLDPWFKRRYPLLHLKKSIYWVLFEQYVVRDAAGVCFTCEDEKLLARETFRPYEVTERVVSYGTATPAGNPKFQRRAFFQRCPETLNKNIFLFLGRIHEKKGCDLLIKAFAATAAKERRNHLVIAGPDATGLQPKLADLARRLGISDRISWPGMLSGDLKWGAFHAADVFVLPSHQENFGIAVAEALACRCPVLISNKVNIWREIESDGGGIIFDDTVEGTVSGISSWLQMPAQAKQAMRKSAVEIFFTKFEMQLAAQRLIELIQQDAMPDSIARLSRQKAARWTALQGMSELHTSAEQQVSRMKESRDSSSKSK